MLHDQLYKETILELNRHPLNKKLLADFDSEAREFNPVCGEDITVRIKFDKDSKMKDIGFQGDSCAISQAAVSLITDDVKEKNKAVISNMGLKDVNALLGMEVIPTRVQCALLGLKAIQKCIHSF